MGPQAGARHIAGDGGPSHAADEAGRGRCEQMNGASIGGPPVLVGALNRGVLAGNSALQREDVPRP